MLIGYVSDEQHVAIDQGTEGVERAIELALPVQGGRERGRGSRRQGDGEIGHEAEG